jgi:Nitronate monooxygenase
VPDFRAQREMLVELRVPVAGFTFGLLSSADVERFHANDNYVVGTATHVVEGIAWRDAGADAVVAQGAEAGGHRGNFMGAFEDALVGTMALFAATGRRDRTAGARARRASRGDGHRVADQRGECESRGMENPRTRRSARRGRTDGAARAGMAGEHRADRRVHSVIDWPI